MANAESSSNDTAVPWSRVERFVGQLTHDVRNGLNALELQLTYLGEICTDPEAVEETKRLRKSLTEVTRQLSAIRLATAGPAPLAMDYPADEFFADVRERYERQDAEAAAKVSWKIDLGTASLAIDPELTMSALLEVFKNAGRYGSVSTAVAAQAAGSAATITITEQKPADAPPAPTAGWSFEPLCSTKRSAYGLGLFRVGRILRAQGGAISAAYSAPEQTLTTTITLPLAGVA